MMRNILILHETLQLWYYHYKLFLKKDTNEIPLATMDIPYITQGPPFINHCGNSVYTK